MEQEAPMNLIDNVNLVVKYLKRKQAWKWQFIRYSIFRKLITHVTGYSRLYYIRKIFLYLVENEYFIKKKQTRDHTFINLKVIRKPMLLIRKLQLILIKYLNWFNNFQKY